MSNKTTFKRIALAVVSALGLGVLASGPSSAIIASPTMAISSSTASVTAGETATAVITVSFSSFGGVSTDTMAVTAIQTAGTTTGGSAPAWRAAAAADSANATAIQVISNTVEVLAVADKAVTATLRYDLVGFTTAGTYAWTFYPSFKTAGAQPSPQPAPVTFTVTVAAKDVKPSATFSKAYVNGGTYYTAKPTADSSVVVTAGLASSPARVAWISADLRNSSDTNVVTGTSVNESVTAVITGPGFISLGTNDTRLRAVTLLNSTDTISVWSDGTAGVATITLSTTTLTTWTSKSVTFAGSAASATLALPASVTTTGVLASDSQTVLRVTPKDSAGNLVTAATYMYVHSSDTKVVANSTISDSCTVTATAADGYGTCGVKIVDSGTTKIKLANFAFGTAAASLPTTQIVTNEVDLIIAGNAATFTLAFDKRTYKPGEVAKITVTVLDAAKRPIGNQTLVSLFETGGVTASPAFGANSTSGETITVAAATHGVGKYTYSVTMPTVAGDVVASAKGYLALPTAGRVVVSDTVTVADPAEDAANSALDAAQEATDAAIAATDAAILAQEAADEAAAAATAAQETAQAAVDAVTALSGQVTKLVAQLATLQKLINRIAKKVGVKR